MYICRAKTKKNITMKIIIYEHIPFSSKVKEVVKEFPSSINVLFIKSPGGRGKATNKDYPLILWEFVPTK